jgi:hypothetical protein
MPEPRIHFALASDIFMVATGQEKVRDIGSFKKKLNHEIIVREN